MDNSSYFDKLNDPRNKIFFGFCAIFLSVLFFYTFFMPSTLAPYRDSGEMTMDIWSLSISHQPGYPLYNIVGRMFYFLPFENLAYKLNLLSAVFGALASGAVFLVLFPLSGFFGALFLSLLFSVNFTVQTVSSVSEMYSMHIFFAAVMVALALKINRKENVSALEFYLLAYLGGLFMGNRMEISLIYPSIFFLLFDKIKKSFNPISMVFKSSLFFFFGFSVYLYLCFRSYSGPLINWSNPCELDNFLRIITRKSYGSTLDLISLNYQKGEMFLPNILEYGKHILVNFNVGLIAVLSGFWILRKEGKLLIFFLSAFILSGPVFLYLANMPPNPHSLAIVEPYYALADMMLIFVAGFCFFRISEKKYKFVFLSLIFLAIATALNLNFPQSDRSRLLATKDYAEDVFSLAEKDSIIVARKDVQLFSLWHFAYVENLRPDLKIIGQGLSGALWYKKSKINKDIYVPSLLDSKEGWDELKVNKRKIYATNDCEIPEGIDSKPLGLIYEVFPENKKIDIQKIENSAHKNFSKPYNDFFVSDLASSYAAGMVSVVSYSLKNAIVPAEALKLLDYAVKLDEDLAEAYLYKGFYFSLLLKWKEAAAAFDEAQGRYDILLEKAAQYKSLDNVKKSLIEQVAVACVNAGVAYEKIGAIEESEKRHRKALFYDPSYYQAHYNIAVLYWSRDKKKAKEELLNALRINPAYEQARFYLNKI